MAVMQYARGGAYFVSDLPHHMMLMFSYLIGWLPCRLEVCALGPVAPDPVRVCMYTCVLSTHPTTDLICFLLQKWGTFELLRMLQTGAEPWVDELRLDGSLVLRLTADARRTVWEFGQTPDLQTRFGPSAVERARRLNPPAVAPRRGCGSNRRQRASLKTAMHAADVSSLGDDIARALSLRTSVESFFRPTSPYAFGNLSDGRQELLRRVAALPRERSSTHTMMAPHVSRLPQHRSFDEFRRSLAGHDMVRTGRLLPSPP